MKRTALVGAAVLVTAAAVVGMQLWRANLTIGDVLGQPARFDLAAALGSGGSVARGPRIDFLSARPIGAAVQPDDRPLVSNVQIADLDRDGLADVLVADAAANRIGWLRQAPARQFTEQTIAEVAGPAHVTACLQRLGPRRRAKPRVV